MPIGNPIRAGWPLSTGGYGPKDCRESGRVAVLADAGLSDVDTELEEFSVDSRSAPHRVLAAHPSDQVEDVFRNCGPPGPGASTLPSPEQLNPGQPRPEEPVCARQPRSLLRRALKDAGLMPEHEVFQLESGLVLKLRRGPQPARGARRTSVYASDGEHANPMFSDSSGFLKGISKTGRQPEKPKWKSPLGRLAPAGGTMVQTKPCLLDAHLSLAAWPSR